MKTNVPLKRFIPWVIALLVVAFSTAGLVSADASAPPGIDAVLAEIRQTQGIGATDAIDVSKIDAALFVELGDSVMETVIGDSALHDRMDAALGGDGSATLDAYHTRLALKYLSGATVSWSDLMGPAMMGGTAGGYRSGMMGGFRGGMMGGSGTSVTYDPTGTNRAVSSATPWYGWVGMGLVALFALGLLVLLAVFLARTSRRTAAAESTEPGSREALGLLAARYAKGEIGDEEYRKKRDAIGGK